MTWHDMTEFLYLRDVDRLILREWLNGAWAVAYACAFYVFADYLIREWHRVRHEGAEAPRTVSETWRLFRNIRANKAAAAWCILCGGETVARLWTWLVILFQVNGWGSPSLVGDFYVVIFATVVAIWATMCIMYVFAQTHRVWIVSTLLVVAFLIVEIAFTPAQ